MGSFDFCVVGGLVYTNPFSQHGAVLDLIGDMRVVHVSSQVLRAWILVFGVRIAGVNNIRGGDGFNGLFWAWIDSAVVSPLDLVSYRETLSSTTFLGAFLR